MTSVLRRKTATCETVLRLSMGWCQVDKSHGGGTTGSSHKRPSQQRVTTKKRNCATRGTINLPRRHGTDPEQNCEPTCATSDSPRRLATHRPAVAAAKVWSEECLPTQTHHKNQKCNSETEIARGPQPTEAPAANYMTTTMNYRTHVPEVRTTAFKLPLP